MQLQELLDHVVAKRVAHAPTGMPPTTDRRIRIRPQDITQDPLIRHVTVGTTPHVRRRMPCQAFAIVGRAIPRSRQLTNLA
eukprot:scaffold7055_cov254-Pinguiococcus_pyrenoidosus.AAC.22